MPVRSRKLAPEAAASEAAAYESAVRLLAMREHSASELGRKLKQRGYARPAIDAALARVAESGALSDTRFVASFIRQRVARGQGPIRIQAELRGQGIDAASIEVALAAAGVDWTATALRVYRQKFGGASAGRADVPADDPPDDPPDSPSGRVAPPAAAERAKRARFLQYRGFDSEQIRAVLGSADADAPDPTFPETW